MLASVQSVEEALIALECGADIIDLKNPHEGALGALPLPTIREIVQAIDHRRPVSATIGDMPMQGDLLVEAVRKTAATGVDIVKVGFFGGVGHEGCVHALAPLADQGVHIVAVLFADLNPEFGLLPALAHAGFHGAMLDTSSKHERSLGGCLDEESLRLFVGISRALGLLTGLAGSLALGDILKLAEIGPDYLGFRGALCCGSDRKSAIDRDRIIRVAKLLYSCNTALPEPA
jgi:uncharacterized protein (UPF0264 family)